MKLCDLAADFGKFWRKSSFAKKLMGECRERFSHSSLSIKNDHHDRDDNDGNARDAIVVARVLDIIIITVLFFFFFFFFLLRRLSLVVVKEKNTKEKKRKQQLRER